MTQTLIFSFPKTSLPDGVTTIPPTSLGVSANSVLASLARNTTADPTIWPNVATTLDVDLQVSFDNRATWVELGGCGDIGGHRLDKHGVEVTVTSLSRQFPAQPTDVKGTITVTNGPLVTAGSVYAVT